ncbi:MAG: hypothetical protein ACP5N1_07180 [Candidatus Woesearchaeota archaeon]
MIPTPYLFTIETPTLLFNKHLFQLGDETTSNINFLEMSGKKFNLSEIATPGVLENIYFDNNKGLFERYKQDFISSSMNQIYISSETIASELRNNKTLSLIINEILPVITSVKVDNQLDAALNDKVYDSKEDIKDIFSKVNATSNNTRHGDNSEIVNKTRDELIKKIEKEYSRVGIKKSKQSDLETSISQALRGDTRNSQYNSPIEPSILSNELLGDENFIFIENRSYELCNVSKLMSEFRNKISTSYWNELSNIHSDIDPRIVVDSVRRNYNQIDSSVVSRIINKLNSTRLNIDGNFFFPLYYNESSDLISDYKKLIEKRLKIDSVNHAIFQAESLKKIEEEKSQLSKLVNTDKFEINGAGFEKIDGSYYVFITTPEYVLRSPHNDHYYKFGRAKIGLEIIARGYNNIEIREPCVLNRYKHPFLPGDNANQKICMGVYNTNSARRLSPGQAVLTILTKAQENLMLGYKSGGNPHNTLNESKFSSYRISDAEFRRSGLVCLNDYR